MGAPSAADIELSFYEEFFFSLDREPYPVQERAFSAIFSGTGVIVAVPTGTGKTLIAKAAIYRALRLGQRAIYTTPLRALTEEKYRELCEDFGADNVGFATGDYKENPGAPIQVLVAEILWNKIFGDRGSPPADVVVMDEGHYFNDYSRGYVWEQSIIGLHPTTQLVILSATIGHADQFCHWATLTRKTKHELIESHERKVPLYHEYREDYLIEVVRELAAAGDVPAIVFVFGREKCFDVARLLKSCRRFTTDEDKAQVEAALDKVLLDGGAADEIRSLLVHGIGIHHAGILPRYKALVERLARERLVKFIISTETISAGINLPAKRVVFTSLRKYISGKGRLLLPAEYHQMAGRAGRPQFDTEGIAIALGPEDVVQEARKEIKTAKKKGHKVDEEKIRKSVYARAHDAAKKRDDVIYDKPAHQKLVQGQPAALRSRTQITAPQVLAIGLPDLTETEITDEVDADDTVEDSLPPCMNLNILTVVANLLLPERQRRDALRRLAHVTDNLRAIGVVDEHGQQVSGELIGKLPGLDGMFVYYLLRNHELEQDDFVSVVEYLVDHGVIQRKLDRKDIDKKKAWIREQLREQRRENPHVTWDDVEAEYDKKFPRELTRIEVIHSEFAAAVPHPELHGGKRAKNVWAKIVESEVGFTEFVDRNGLAHEEGSLFSYLARCMRVSNALFEATGLDGFETLEQAVRSYLGVIETRLV